MQPYKSRILVVNDGSFRVDFNADNTDCRAAEIDEAPANEETSVKAVKTENRCESNSDNAENTTKEIKPVFTYISRVANMRLSTLQPTAKQVKNL